VVLLALEEVRLLDAHGELQVPDGLRLAAHALLGLLPEVARHLLFLLVHIHVVLVPQVADLVHSSRKQR
jgi:hypothetical protein